MAARFEPAQQIRRAQFVSQREGAWLQFRGAPSHLNGQCGGSARAIGQPLHPFPGRFAIVAFARRFRARAEFFQQAPQSVPIGQPFRRKRVWRDEQPVERAERQQPWLI